MNHPRIPYSRREKQRGCSLEFLSTRYKVTDGLYSLVRRLMIPLAAVFADILQHSHSTGFRSGATARIIFPPPRSAYGYGFEIGCSIASRRVVPLHLECIGERFSFVSLSTVLRIRTLGPWVWTDNHAARIFRCLDFAPKLSVREALYI